MAPTLAEPATEAAHFGRVLEPRRAARLRYLREPPATAGRPLVLSASQPNASARPRPRPVVFPRNRPDAAGMSRPVPRFRLGAVLGVNQTLSWGMTFYLPAIIAEPVAATLAQPGYAVLGAFSWAMLVAGLCAPRVGAWIDHHGGRGALLGSIVVMAAGMALL